MIRNATLILLLAASFAGCSSEAKNNESSNNAATNNSADAGNNTFVDVDNSGATYAQEYEVIFDSIAFTTDPANRLNMLLNANLDLNLDYPIIVLLKLSDIDPEAGTLVLEGGSGLKTTTMGEYTFDPDSDSNGTSGTLAASSGEFSAQMDFFGFVATFVFENDISKTVLPINDLTIGGQRARADDGTAGVVNGTLAGFMTKTDGDTTEITLTPGGTPISLTQVFKEETLNFDTNTGTMVDRGTGDAWFLQGTFSAVPTTIND